MSLRICEASDIGRGQWQNGRGSYGRGEVLTSTAVRENEDAFMRYFFRPRILRDVTTGSTATEWMGIKSELPIFICPAAMAKLGHPLGEVNLTKGAGRCGIVQGVRSFILSPSPSAAPSYRAGLPECLPSCYMQVCRDRLS